MLQIASGKLFKNPPSRKNKLRGILYSNMVCVDTHVVETVAGRLTPTSLNVGGHQHFVYELTEMMEQPPASGVIVSHGIEPYIRDFSAVFTLGMNVLCSTTEEEIRRLTSREERKNELFAPSAFIPRVFDKQVIVRDSEISSFVNFVNELLDLKRKNFLTAVRAIKTYVVALHRLGDDLDLSYPLMVASIESLAQAFDEFDTTWDEYDETRKAKIDLALSGADEATANNVRETLLNIEKFGLARRFREFTKAHVRNSFYREETAGVLNPISRADLDQGLREAYRIRSGFIHNLRELPRELTMTASPVESMESNGVVRFTFRGLARLVRHVIMDFVHTSPKVDKEEYDYRKERFGIVNLPLAPEYWIGNSENLSLESGNKRLGAFMTLLSGNYAKKEDAKLPDLRSLLGKAEGLMIAGSEEARRPFLTLYLAFNFVIPLDERMSHAENIRRKFGSELEGPSIESMVTHLVMRISPQWSLNDHLNVFEEYLERRNKKNGLRLPRTFEAGIALEIAERIRVQGDAPRALTMVSRAVEYYPEHEPLRELEACFDPEKEIHWFNTVFPEAPIRAN